MTKKISTAFIACALTAAALTRIAQLMGSITDSSNAVIPGVRITVTNLDTGVKRNGFHQRSRLRHESRCPGGPIVRDAPFFESPRPTPTRARRRR